MIRGKNMSKLPVKAVLAAIFCNMLFGSASPFIKLGYDYFSIVDDVFSKILYAGIRFFISGIIVFLIDIIMSKKIPTVSRGNRMNVFFTAITYTFLQYTFFYIGLSKTTGALASVINSSSAFVAVILAHFIYRDDKLNISKAAGCVFGFLGVLLACLTNTGAESFEFIGEGFIFLTALFFVVGSVINKKSTQKNSSFTVTAYNLLIGGFLLILAGLFGYKGEIVITVKGVLVLGYLILVSSVGFTLWSSLLKKYPIGKLSVYNFIIPVSGTLFSGLFLKENVFTLQFVIALVLVSFGIFVVNRTSAKK